MTLSEMWCVGKNANRKFGIPMLLSEIRPSKIWSSEIRPSEKSRGSDLEVRDAEGLIFLNLHMI